MRFFFAICPAVVSPFAIRAGALALITRGNVGKTNLLGRIFDMGVEVFHPAPLLILEWTVVGRARSQFVLAVIGKEVLSAVFALAVGFAPGVVGPTVGASLGDHSIWEEQQLDNGGLQHQAQGD